MRCSILRDLGAPRTASPLDQAVTRQATARPFITRPLSEPRIDVVDLDKGQLQDASNDPQVRAIAPVMPTALIVPLAENHRGVVDDEGESTWGVSAVGAESSELTGVGVTAAILDTGIDAAHPAFADMTVVEKDFTQTGNGDKQGHGTHVAGTVCGQPVEGRRIGVAPGVDRVLAGKVLGDDGRGDSDMILKGLQWAADSGAHVACMSLGFDFPGLVDRLVALGQPVPLATSTALEAYRANLRLFDALMDLLRANAAFGSGIVVVAAAGNESRRDAESPYEVAVALPAAAEGIVSVGALGRTEDGLRIAPFSNTFPQISAPGVDVLSARAGGGLVRLNGTSMAAPHVTGVAALWWEQARLVRLPQDAETVAARLLAHGDLHALAPDVDTADRGVGLAQAPA
jgi:subtilisin family serine protease